MNSGVWHFRRMGQVPFAESDLRTVRFSGPVDPLGRTVDGPLKLMERLGVPRGDWKKLPSLLLSMMSYLYVNK